jgi:hypothetical protein
MERKSTARKWNSQSTVKKLNDLNRWNTALRIRFGLIYKKT